MKLLIGIATLVALATVVGAQQMPEGCNTDLDFAQVIAAQARADGDRWSFSATVRHNDEGWDHYADEWRVEDLQTGEVYGVRTLYHPHDDEQPFTRSLSGVQIPAGVDRVLVRAKCNVHGYGGCGVVVDLRP